MGTDSVATRELHVPAGYQGIECPQIWLVSGVRPTCKTESSASWLVCSASVSPRKRRQTQRRRPFEDRGRHYSNSSTSQGIPAVTRSWKRQGRASPLTPQSLQREHGPADTLLSDFWPPEL
ncbi:unnamed protein product [Nyctereutes procyonoides]|uniref:(raccoon dog) hypothetical protein n=1 Tax=Nyctereutes procyonoides TaxID=34880 RepID=A0A811YWG5_NYCPR|nr:unnamed protein product [Nyctereutes procyonoides]